MNWPTFEAKECRCTACRRPLDAATAIEHDRPNDFTICAGCGQLLRFNDDLSVRAIDDRELRELDRRSRGLLLAARQCFSSSKRKRHK